LTCSKQDRPTYCTGSSRQRKTCACFKSNLFADKRISRVSVRFVIRPISLFRPTPHLSFVCREIQKETDVKNYVSEPQDFLTGQHRRVLLFTKDWWAQCEWITIWDWEIHWTSHRYLPMVYHSH